MLRLFLDIIFIFYMDDNELFLFGLSQNEKYAWEE